MSAIKKRKIVIASILKPVDDTRMFEKMAKSLAATNQFEIIVIGFPTAAHQAEHENITIIPFRSFKRISIARLAARWQYLKILFQVKPDVIIFNTHELIDPSVFYKAFSGVKIIYDIQENYFRNILFVPVFPFYLRPFIAVYVRTKEILLSPFINHFILAEQGYESELGFIKKQFTVVENKVIKNTNPFGESEKRNESINLLFSGTLATTTGIFEAIDLAKNLYRLNSSVRLTIIGYCAQPAVFKKICSQIQQSGFIHIIGGNVLVPHSKIVSEIVQADFGIISYPPNHSTTNSIPTKLFEYLGYQLPILLTNHSVWVNRCSPYNACIEIDFTKPDYKAILNQMETAKFYTSVPENIFWEDELDKLLMLL